MGETDWLGLVLVSRAMLSKSLIQFSVDGWGCVPSLLFTWGQTILEVMRIMAKSFKSSHAHTATVSAPNPAAGHGWPTSLLETPGHSRASLGQSLVVPLLLSLGPSAHKVLFVLQRVCFPGLCTFWQLYGGVNGDPLQEGLCHTQVCCTQTCISTGGTQRQFCLSLGGVSGSWCTQGLFEPSECLWRVWGLILNVILPLLPSCWGFSFSLRCGVSPQSCSSTA